MKRWGFSRPALLGASAPKCIQPTRTQGPAAEPPRREALVAMSLGVSDTIAGPISRIHAKVVGMLRPGLAEALEIVGGAQRALTCIWRTGLARALLRFAIHAGGAERVWRHVSMVGPRPRSGCVLAILHSPWNRVVVHWAPVMGSALVLAGNPWRTALGRRRVPAGQPGYRRVIRHLRAGGLAVAVSDRFAGRRTRPVRFLEREVKVSTLVVRLAAAARVPVIPVSTTYQGGEIRITFGPAPWGTHGAQSETEVAQAILAFFEREVRRDAASWVDLSAFIAPSRTTGHSPERKRSRSTGMVCQAEVRAAADAQAGRDSSIPYRRSFL